MARAAVQYAAETGRLKKPKGCEKCGKRGAVIPHHNNGYTGKHSLEVQWLCLDCHKAAEIRSLSECSEKEITAYLVEDGYLNSVAEGIARRMKHGS